MQGISVFDWKIYQHLFSAAEMEAVFAETNSIACWIEVERATARAQAKVSIIPENAASEIDEARFVSVEDFDELKWVSEAMKSIAKNALTQTPFSTTDYSQQRGYPYLLHQNKEVRV